MAKKLMSPTAASDLFGTPAPKPIPPAKVLNKKRPPQRYTKAQKVVIKKKKQAHADKIRPVTVVLSYGHNINGFPYGPGKVRVSQPLADVLLENERNIRKSEDQFYGTKAMVIGPRGPRGHTARQVDPGMFDTGGYLNVMPLGSFNPQGEPV